MALFKVAANQKGSLVLVTIGGIIAAEIDGGLVRLGYVTGVGTNGKVEFLVYKDVSIAIRRCLNLVPLGEVSFVITADDYDKVLDL